MCVGLICPVYKTERVRSTEHRTHVRGTGREMTRREIGNPEGHERVGEGVGGGERGGEGEGEGEGEGDGRGEGEGEGEAEGGGEVKEGIDAPGAPLPLGPAFWPAVPCALKQCDHAGETMGGREAG
ncbi:unnamed protein product [Closterium sp. NIES-54]